MRTESLYIPNWEAALMGLAAGLVISCSNVPPINNGSSSADTARRTGKAQVYGLKGEVKFTVDGASWTPVRLGTVLRPDTVVRTGDRSGADLVLGKNGLLLHVGEDSLLGIEKLEYGDHPGGTVIHTRLNLKQGKMAGSIKRWTAGSQYEVVVPTQTISVRENGEFEIWSEGRVVTENCVIQTKDVTVEPQR